MKFTNTSDTESYSDVNPVTGRAWAAAQPDLRTEDEKERSAAELMHLIRQLNAKGVIQCQLPGAGDGDGDGGGSESDE